MFTTNQFLFLLMVLCGTASVMVGQLRTTKEWLQARHLHEGLITLDAIYLIRSYWLCAHMLSQMACGGFFLLLMSRMLDKFHIELGWFGYLIDAGILVCFTWPFIGILLGFIRQLLGKHANPLNHWRTINDAREWYAMHATAGYIGFLILFMDFRWPQWEEEAKKTGIGWTGKIS